MCPKARSTVGKAATPKICLRATHPVSAAQLLLSQVKHCVVATGVRKQPTSQCSRTAQAGIATQQPHAQQRPCPHSAGARGSPPRIPTGATIGETGRVCSAEQASGASAAALPCFLVVSQLSQVSKSPHWPLAIAQHWASRYRQSDQVKILQRLHLGGTLPALC